MLVSAWMVVCLLETSVQTAHKSCILFLHCSVKCQCIISVVDWTDCGPVKSRAIGTMQNDVTTRKTTFVIKSEKAKDQGFNNESTDPNLTMKVNALSGWPCGQMLRLWTNWSQRAKQKMKHMSEDLGKKIWSTMMAMVKTRMDNKVDCICLQQLRLTRSTERRRCWQHCDLLMMECMHAENTFSNTKEEDGHNIRGAIKISTKQQDEKENTMIFNNWIKTGQPANDFKNPILRPNSNLTF